MIIECQEFVLDLGLRRDFASVKNVADSNPVLGQSASNEETTVTIERIVFGAQEGNAIVLCALNNTAQSVAELLGLGHLLVVSHTVAVELGLLGTPAEFMAQENVQNSVLTQFLAQFVAIKVRAAPGVGRGANIGHRHYTGATQERGEVLPCMRRMSDGQNAQRISHLHQLAAKVIDRRNASSHATGVLGHQAAEGAPANLYGFRPIGPQGRAAANALTPLAAAAVLGAHHGAAKARVAADDADVQDTSARASATVRQLPGHR